MDEASLFSDRDHGTDGSTEGYFDYQDLLVSFGTDSVPRKRPSLRIRTLGMSLCLVALWIFAWDLSAIVFGGGVIAAMTSLWMAMNGTILVNSVLVAWLNGHTD